MIPNIVITLHVVAGHIVPAHIVIPHVMSAARYHQLYGAASYINWFPVALTASLTAAIAMAVAVVTSSFTRLWKRTA